MSEQRHGAARRPGRQDAEACRSTASAILPFHRLPPSSGRHALGGALGRQAPSPGPQAAPRAPRSPMAQAPPQLGQQRDGRLAHADGDVIQVGHQRFQQRLARVGVRLEGEQVELGPGEPAGGRGGGGRACALGRHWPLSAVSASTQPDGGRCAVASWGVVWGRRPCQADAVPFKQAALVSAAGPHVY